MRQLRLTDTTESLWDWMLEWAEEQGIDLGHDPDWDATNARMVDAFPSRFFNAQAARRLWTHDQIADLRQRHGQRRVPPIKLQPAEEGAEEQEGKATGEAWVQMTLFNFVKYASGLTRSYKNDKAQRDAKIVAWLEVHADSGETVKTLTSRIDRAAR